MFTLANVQHLLSAVKDGNIEAFKYLFDAYYPRLVNFAVGYVGSRELAEDMVQECFARLWEYRKDLVVPSTQAILFTMVRNECLNEIKHLSVTRNYEQYVKGRANDHERLYNLDFTGRSDGLVLFDELQAQIDRVVDEMPPRTREVFLLSRFQGKKNREIANLLGISEGVVENHITKALRLFSKHNLG